MTRTPGGAGTVIVRLSDVPVDVRLRAADRIIRREKLQGLEALEIGMAARMPRHDPRLRVSKAEADRVLR